MVKSKLCKMFLFCLVSLFSNLLIQARENPSSYCMEFKDQKITDILLSLAAYFGVSVVTDETVRGRASYFLKEESIDAALEGFLPAYKLYHWRENEIIYVSKLRIRPSKPRGSLDPEGSFAIDGDEIDPHFLLLELSRKSGKTIIYKDLPQSPVTIHVKNASISDVLQILTDLGEDLHFEKKKNYYVLCSAKSENEPENGRTQNSRPSLPLNQEAGLSAMDLVLSKEGGFYSLSFEKTDFDFLLTSLFHKAGRDYLKLTSQNPIIHNVSLKNKSFDHLLSLILGQIGAAFEKREAVYIIYDVGQSAFLDSLRKTEIIPVRYISPDKISSLFPSGFSSSSRLRIDADRNLLIVHGTALERQRIRRFIKVADQPQGINPLLRICPHHIKSEDLLRLLPPELSAFNPVLLPGDRGLLFSLPAAMRERLDTFLDLVDIPQKLHPLRLKNINAAELLDRVPAELGKNDLVPSGNDSLIYYRGSEKEYKQVKKYMEEIDILKKQIRYEILIIQYQEGSRSSLNVALSSKAMKPGDHTTFFGNIDNLLSLDFDVVSAFGYQFALRLNAELSENAAKVIADTTLNGISGAEIKFQNSDTYRYRDYQYDPDSDEYISTGITREISSGLFLNLRGRAFDNGKIVMDIKATVSKRGADLSNKAADPPPTAEKIFSTRVRADSGKPVIIGGLVQEYRVKSERPIPVLGYLPLLSALFRNSTESLERTEMVMYILPFIENDSQEERSVEEKMDHAFEKLLEDGAKGWKDDG